MLGVLDPQPHQPRGQRRQDARARRALGEPGAGDRVQRAGRDDPVVRRPLRHPSRPVPGDDGRVVPGGVQMPACRLRDVGVQIDGRDQVVPQPVREQGGVVTGAGADLQHPVPVLHLQLGQHLRHQRRLAAGGDQHPVAHPRGERCVRVRAPHPAVTPPGVALLAPQPLEAARDADVVVRHEEVPGNALERLPPIRVGVPRPARLDLAHQRRAGLGGEAFQVVIHSVRAHTSTVRPDASRGEHHGTPVRNPPVRALRPAHGRRPAPARSPAAPRTPLGWS